MLMPTRDQLLALTDELRRLKAGGERRVTVSEESLEQLRAAVNTRVAEVAEVAAAEVRPPEPIPSAPSKISVPVAAVSRAAPPPGPAKFSAAPPVVPVFTGDKTTRWEALRDLVRNDPVCRAQAGPGKKIVLGAGSLEAALFFVGEAPGADEEVQGEPFVGEPGQLLTKMIQGMGPRREQVYLCNVMNWRPAIPTGPGDVQLGNRPPTAEEMNYCLPYLRAQIEIVQPQVIVALGATAAGALLGAHTFKTLGEIKGRWQEFAGRPVMVTYHPSYVLRSNTSRAKRAVWEDLLQVMERVGLAPTEKQRGFFL